MTSPFDGEIDEFRLSIGIGRHTSGFTPPSEEYSAGVGIEASSFNLGLTLGSYVAQVPKDISVSSQPLGLTQPAPVLLNHFEIDVASQPLGLTQETYSVGITIVPFTVALEFPGMTLEGIGSVGFKWNC